MRDFSRAPREIRFTADGEQYDCLPALAPETLQEMLAALKTVRDDTVGALKSVLEMVLTPESAARMVPRLYKAHANPIDVNQAIDICRWLAEQYSERPTQPSISSSDGSATGADGTTSTDGQPAAA